MKKLGIGIDLAPINRFSKFKSTSPFLKRVYTINELRYCFSKGLPSEHLAGRFSAKEAVRKALASIIKQPIDYREIEIINDKDGHPEVFLKSRERNRFRISLSISHAAGMAAAVAIVNLK